MNQANWCDPEQIQYSWGLLVYMALTVFFAYFYTTVSFNTEDIANNMKNNGGFIPGIRPGKPTMDYLNRILSRLTLAGALFLSVIVMISAIVMFFMKIQSSLYKN